MIPTQHPYYSKSKKEQNQFQLKLGGISLLIVLASVVLAFLTKFYLFPILVIGGGLSIIAPFFDVPSLVKSGRLSYYSPLFLVEKERNGTRVIHGGTLFDYYFVIDRNLTGQERTRFILSAFLTGLIKLIEDYEEKSIADITLKGTTYIINERTAKRMGFRKVRQNGGQTLILAFNYFNLMASNFLSKGQLTFPNLANIMTIEGSLSEIASKKAYFVALRNRINLT